MLVVRRTYQQDSNSKATILDITEWQIPSNPPPPPPHSVLSQTHSNIYWQKFADEKSVLNSKYLFFP